jgi:hypothetical protein
MLSKNRGYLPHAPGSTKPLHVSTVISTFEHVASISWITVLRARVSRSWRTLERQCPSTRLELEVCPKPKPHAILKTGAICRMPQASPNHCTIRQCYRFLSMWLPFHESLYSGRRVGVRIGLWNANVHLPALKPL